jgi:ADP-ribosylglycohydrolase
MPLPHDHNARLARARLALEGLSVGDGFGQRFFGPGVLERLLPKRQLPHAPWRYTDDTEMALAIYEVLARHGRIEQDELAAGLARRYLADPARGYGSGAHTILADLCRGADWRVASRRAFGGEGSLGNGGAMRVAPLGAYWADDHARLAHEAAASAAVTHAHAEGQAGAVAVAIAAAWAWKWREAKCREDPIGLLHAALEFTPEGVTRDGIAAASEIPLDEWEHTAATLLGNGSQVTAPDTVPFCLWSAAAHLTDYCEALWTAVRVGGDLDTNCAIVGGIVAMAVGQSGIPDQWRTSRESLWLCSEEPYSRSR